MATKQPRKTTFDVAQVLRPIYTGGAVALAGDGRLLATAFGEDVVLTDPSTGVNLTEVEGVSRENRMTIKQPQWLTQLLGWRANIQFDMFVSLEPRTVGCC